MNFWTPKLFVDSIPPILVYTILESALQVAFNRYK